MFCPQCGANNADNAMVCMQCGRSLQGGTTPAPLPGTTPLPPGTTVPNYLVFAILTTVFCCIATGIPAIVYAAQVNSKLQAGDLAGAQVASSNAKMWCLVSVGVGLFIGAIYAALMVVGVLSGVRHPH